MTANATPTLTYKRYRKTPKRRHWVGYLRSLTDATASLGATMTTENPEDRGELLGHASTCLAEYRVPNSYTWKQVAALKVDFNADKLVALHAECLRSVALTTAHIAKMDEAWRCYRLKVVTSTARQSVI
ncbi:hypothetical protein [Paraburkholderia tropica]|uniref:hypothetical protein n=1 Tax=Paraburkholderia tropica TaxID=92647 RepID=UPI002AB6B1BA|nr:hypothetical protein [Paraburkholderia tropica]